MIQCGKRIGPYEVSEHMASGAMSDVYRARDSRNGSDAAIKVLTPCLAGDRIFVLRLLCEARILARLRHPHICAFRDAGHDAGRGYLAMELLAGESLENRLQRGALPSLEVLDFAIQIAHALECAHAAGVIHRDLKPSNIMLTPTGAKLLDFGLAQTPDGGAGEDFEGPLSVNGALVGTVAYMAPEQLNCAPVDARADIFSLGATIYEMFSGIRAFTGHNRASVIGAVLFREPRAINVRRPAIPSPIRDVLAGCLEKDPQMRVPTVRELRVRLEEARTALPATSLTRPKGRRVHATAGY
jgi:eukaryotic-like serine/threonine-protein kinase